MPDPFKIPKEMGIFQLVDSKNDTTTDLIISRIIDHRSVVKSFILFYTFTVCNKKILLYVQATV